jgi:DNA-binding CsgD family transcriptional regulator
MAGTSRNREGSSPLLERDEQLAAVSRLLEAAAVGKGATAVIVGSAGTGKSALLSAATDAARRRGLSVRRARGSELELELSFGVIRQLYEPVLSATPEAKRERLLAGAAMPARRLFTDGPLDPAVGRDGSFATLHALYWLTASIAADRPLVLAVDDIHWVDPPSLRALNYLAARIDELPAVLVVGHRPHEPTAGADLAEALESHPQAIRLELSSLGPKAVTTLVRAAHPKAGDDLCAAFYEASAGNPFYLRELLRTVGTANRTLPSATDVRAAAVTSVGDRVLRRIAKLGPEAPRVAAAMSVLGACGRLVDAAATAGQEVDAVAKASLAMRRVEILAAEDPFEWIHPLVRRSIYDGLTVVERDCLHARAAEVLRDSGAPPGVIAAHLSALRPSGSSTVVTGLTVAADEAMARDAPEVAVALLRRALDERAVAPSRASLLLKLGQIEVTRRNPLAAEILREARELTSDPQERALAALGLGESFVFEGRWDAAAQISEQALVEAAGVSPELALELELTRVLVCAMDPELAPAFWSDQERLLSISRGNSWPARALSAALAMTFSYRGERLDQVASMCEHALADGVLLSERGAGAFASGHIIATLATIDAHERALEFADELEGAARAQGSVANSIAATACRGWISLRRGDLVTGDEILRPLAETAAANGMFLILVTVLWWLTDVLLERPSQDELATLIQSLELPPGFAEAGGGAWALSVRGRIRAQNGARADAERDLRAAADIFTRLGFGPMHETSRSALALVLGAERRDEAQALVAEELALAEATGFARPRGTVLRAAGLLTGGNEGVELLRESVAILEKSSSRYEHARSLVELGAALRRTGRRADARHPLQDGMELAHGCGAERLVARTREELLASGGRPRRIVRSGFDGLTASERRVVRMVAEGYANAEIAQALYVSVKTVETHLSSAYSKLDLSGAGARRRLRELLAADGRGTTVVGTALWPAAERFDATNGHRVAVRARSAGGYRDRIH